MLERHVVELLSVEIEPPVVAPFDGVACDLDRVEDPGELRNLAAEQPDVVVRLAELLADQVEAAAEVGRMYEQGAELQLDEGLG